VVQSAEDLAGDPHLKAKDYFVELEHQVQGNKISESSPIKFTDSTTAGWRAAPLLGEDNRYVYIELLGLRESELSSYIERGVVG